jgi:hypothetical protein
MSTFTTTTLKQLVDLSDPNRGMETEYRFSGGREFKRRRRNIYHEFFSDTLYMPDELIMSDDLIMMDGLGQDTTEIGIYADLIMSSDLVMAA